MKIKIYSNTSLDTVWVYVPDIDWGAYYNIDEKIVYDLTNPSWGMTSDISTEPNNNSQIIMFMDSCWAFYRERVMSNPACTRDWKVSKEEVGSIEVEINNPEVFFDSQKLVLV